VFILDRKLVATAECLLPHVKSTRRCAEAVDKYLRRFLDNKEFRSACRYIVTSRTLAICSEREGVSENSGVENFRGIFREGPTGAAVNSSPV